MSRDLNDALKTLRDAIDGLALKAIAADMRHAADLLDLEGALVIGDDDKPMVDSFLKQAHTMNLAQDVVKAQIGWYFGTYIPELEKARSEQDTEFRAQAQEMLRKDWGADYKANVTAVQTLIGMLPEKERELFWGGRLADGTAIGDHPMVLKWLAQVERERNPASTLVPPDMKNDQSSIEAELKRLDGLLRTDRKAYNLEEARYRTLLEAYQRKTGKEWSRAA